MLIEDVLFSCNTVILYQHLIFVLQEFKGLMISIGWTASLVEVICILLPYLKHGTSSLVLSWNLSSGRDVLIAHERVILLELVLLMALRRLSMLNLLMTKHELVLVLLYSLSWLIIKVMLLLRFLLRHRLRVLNSSVRRNVLLQLSIFDYNWFFDHIDVIIIQHWSHVRVIIWLEDLLLLLGCLMIEYVVIRLQRHAFTCDVVRGFLTLLRD